MWVITIGFGHSQNSHSFSKGQQLGRRGLENISCIPCSVVNPLYHPQKGVPWELH